MVNKNGKGDMSQAELVENLREAYPLNSEFEYLGVKFSVVGHEGFILDWFAQLTAEYVDREGVIRSKTFGYAKAMAMAMKNLEG